MKLLLLLVGLVIYSPNSADYTFATEFHAKDLTEKRLIQLIDLYDKNNNSVSLGYSGLCNAMMANHVWMPTDKLKYFSIGKQKIEEAIERDKDNIELRYLRLMIQLNTPGFLGYNDNVKEDIEYWVTNGNKNFSEHWKKVYLNNLIKSTYISEHDKQKLQKIIG